MTSARTYATILPVLGDQIFVFCVLGASLVLFAGGWWRYDVVALLALLAVALWGAVPPAEAFSGFGHPAVITVAAVLILSEGLRRAGLVELISGWLLRIGDGPAVQVPALVALVVACSAFMNNVGALAILMPVAIHLAHTSRRSPSLLLMPLAFGSLLGGLVTLIGTPPNIIVATLRAELPEAPGPFGMFDYTPVGIVVALAGGAFIALIGWRLVPERRSEGAEEGFRIEDYIFELHAPAGSKLVDKEVYAVEEFAEVNATVVGIMRRHRRVSVPSAHEVIRADDTLLIEAEPSRIQELAGATGLELAGDHEARDEFLESKDMRLVETVIGADSWIAGRTVRQLGMRRRFGINLLAIARRGRRIRTRLADVALELGDVLLLQGDAPAVEQAVRDLRLLPLAERGLDLGTGRRLLLAASIFAAAIAAAVLDLAPIQVAFVAAAVAMVLGRIISVRQVYENVNWPVIVLLAAMIPVGDALERTGGAQQVAEALLGLTSWFPPWAMVAAVLIVTMFLSDLINNAATAVLMVPIAVRVAAGMDVSVDPFLMAVAIGASCAFLTPIGHQSNTLVLGPGGYRFGDYWRMGLPLEGIIAGVAVPLILIVWPLEVGG